MSVPNQPQSDELVPSMAASDPPLQPRQQSDTQRPQRPTPKGSSGLRIMVGLLGIGSLCAALLLEFIGLTILLGQAYVNAQVQSEVAHVYGKMGAKVGPPNPVPEHPVALWSQWLALFFALVGIVCYIRLTVWAVRGVRKSGVVPEDGVSELPG